MIIDSWINYRITLPIESLLCKFNFHRLTWEDDTGLEHCYCRKVIKNPDEQ